MRIEKRLYLISYALIALLSILGENIWLGDPLRWGSYYWIDQIQGLVMLLALVPLLWLAAALTGLLTDRMRSRGMQVLRSGIVIGSCGSTITLLSSLQTDAGLENSLLWIVITLVATIIAIAFIERQQQVRWILRSGLLVLIMLVAAVVLYWPTSYAVTSPGFTLNMNRYAQVENGEEKGQIEGVLVIERPAFPIDWIYAAIWPHIELSKRDTSISIGQIQQEAHRQRTDANEISSAVAFQRLGIGRGVWSDGVHIARVMADSPAKGNLLPGDRITGINGHPVTSVEQLATEMSQITPETSVEVSLIRNQQEVEAVVQTKASEDDEKRAVFGLEVENYVQTDLPRDVDYRSYLVYQGGPSHGAILALTLIDQLTPGGVTFGNRVAGTGTINAEGEVGPIGGIEQKAYVVARSGADVFFVPAEQEEEARKGSSELLIVPVHTLQEMLDWLAKHPK